MTEELYINDECVDLEPGTKLTLNFKSNLLNDISKITSSNSQTIRLRKNTKNRRIIDNPSAVAYYSIYRYKRYKARYIRNGVEVINAAYAVLLSTSEYYEVAVYWGVMANFQAWVDKGAKLTELTGTESLVWNKNITPTTLSQMKSRGYGYARYDCGISNTDLANIHPSATAWWILTKIATQAGFTIEIHDKYKAALQSIAIPCLSKNASSESWIAEKTSVSAYCRTIYEYLGMDVSTGSALMHYAVGCINVKSSIQTHSIYLGDNVEYGYYADYSTSGDINWPHGTDYRTVYMAEFSTLSIDEMEVYIDALSVNSAPSTLIEMCTKRDDADYAVFKSWPLSAGQVIRETINCSEFDKYYFVLKNPKQESAGYEVNIEITPHTEEMTYPSAFRIGLNLPEITQIDFIKAICGMLGIFVIADLANANNLKFVSLGILQDNKAKAVDWSDKLVKSNDDEPKAVEYKINDYCRNNLFKYKEDDTVSRKADGNMKIENEVIEKEKTVITLPFAPSDGSKIPQYKPSSDGTKAEVVSIKDRIMRLINNGAGLSSLTFDGLEFETLLSTYYPVLSRLLNNAIVITEKLTLSESDLKSLDYTIPFYLRQYGKFYGIISIQVSDELCEVKAVQLPETVIEEINPPSLTSNIISVKYEGSGVLAVSEHSLGSDITVSYDYYIIDDPTPIPGTKVFPKNTKEVTLMATTRIFDRLELRSLSPSRDDFFNYIISK